MWKGFVGVAQCGFFTLHYKSYCMGSTTPEEIGKGPTKLFGSCGELQTDWRRWQEMLSTNWMWIKAPSCWENWPHSKGSYWEHLSWAFPNLALLYTRSNMHFLYNSALNGESITLMLNWECLADKAQLKWRPLLNAELKYLIILVYLMSFTPIVH